MLYTNRIIFIDKVINQILIRKNLIWAKLSPSKVCGYLYREKNASVGEVFDRLFAVTGQSKTIDIVLLSSQDKASIIEYADHALRHEFDVLGSGWTKIEPLNWKRDFIHGYSWEQKQFYRNFQLVSPAGGRDIKVIWDLNRSHHLLWLAEAYLITGNEIYADEVVSQLKDWIEVNPLMYSVPWTCSMDVAIRAVNWIYALSMISGSPSVSEEFIRKVMESLYQHLFFIMNNLEKSIPNSGNHYLSDLAGILFISALFPHNRFARLSHRFALKEFEFEVLKQINSDGSNYENSVSYHRLVTELLLYTLVSLNRRKVSVSRSVTERIFRATQYVDFYTKPGGLAPLIADNDNGRLLPFIPRDYRAHGYLSELGRMIFDPKEQGCNGDFLFLNRPRIPFDPIDCRMEVSQAGLAVATRGDCRLLVTNGSFSFNKAREVGKFYGTHTQCDNLSFELTLGEEDFLIDPGTGVYTSDLELRNLLRSNSSHNCLVVDGRNYGDLKEGSAFVIRLLLSNLSLRKDNADGCQSIEGSFNFNAEDLKYALCRKFTLQDAALQIRDRVEIEGTHQISLFFIIAPGIDVDIQGDTLKLISKKHILTLKVMHGSKGVSPLVSEHIFSPSYGVMEPCKRVEYNLSVENNSEINTLMQWKRNA